MRVLTSSNDLLEVYDFKKLYVKNEDSRYIVIGTYNDNSECIIYETSSKEDANEVIYNIYNSNFSKLLVSDNNSDNIMPEIMDYISKIFNNFKESTDNE